MVKNEPRQIEIDGEMIVSDFPNSKNVIKVYEEEDYAIIYTERKEPIFIRSRSIDEFIINSSWWYKYEKKEIKVFYDSDTIPKIEVREYPTYACTTITNKDIENTVSGYQFSKEVKPFKGLVSNQIKGGNIYLHRYLMGLYNVEKVGQYRDKYKISKDEFLKKGLRDLVVDHKEWDTKQNFIDKLRVVKQWQNSRNKSIHNKRLEWLLPIEKHGTTFKMKVLDLNTIVVPRNAKVIAEIIDSDETGENIVQLKRWMLNELWKARISNLKKNRGNILSSESLYISTNLNKKIIIDLLERANRLQNKKSVSIIIN